MGFAEFRGGEKEARMSLQEKLGFLFQHSGFRQEPLKVLFRLAFWYVRARLPRPASITLGRWKLTMEIPPRWRGVSKLVYVFREHYEPELFALEQLVPKGSVAVDVGANYGIYTLVLARLVGPEGKVYSFEPAHEAAQVLRRNVKKNKFYWVHVVQAACADCSAKAWLSHHPDPSKNALVLAQRETDKGEPVEVVRLDDIVEEAAFLKMDVEGAEELVLKGGMNLIERSRPVVMLELNEGAVTSMGLEPWGAWRLLSSKDYSFLVLGQDGSFRVLEAPSPYGNIFAVPQEQLGSCLDSARR